MAKGDDASRKTPPWYSASTAMNAGAWPRSSKDSTCCPPRSRRPPQCGNRQAGMAQGVGPKLKQMLHRGVGVHHAGLLPKYRRVVEDLFRAETADRGRLHGNAGGGDQSASAIGGADAPDEGAVRQGEVDRCQHGPPDIRPGRAAAVRRQGFVYAMAHEDDVRILRWKAEVRRRSPRTRKTRGCSRRRRT